MVVAGVPNKTTFHAHHICDMALDMLSSIDHLKDPSTGDNIQIRVGEWSLSSLAMITHTDYLAGLGFAIGRSRLRVRHPSLIRRLDPCTVQVSFTQALGFKRYRNIILRSWGQQRYFSSTRGLRLSTQIKTLFPYCHRGSLF